MAWEDDVRPGWRPIVAAAVRVLESRGCKIQQVKEKFGGLRIYFTTDTTITTEITNDDIVTVAEWMCDHTCEECGKAGSRRDLPWIKTLCDEHYEERKKRYK